MEGSIFANDELQRSNVMGTNTSVEWVVENLNEKNQAFKDARGNSKVTKVDAFDVSSGKGFVSKVYKISFYFENKCEPFVAILKIPGFDCIQEAMDLQNMGLDERTDSLYGCLLINYHIRECQFYNTYANIPDLKIVKCYGTKDWIVGSQEGALIMDYLGSTGTNIEFMHGLNVYQIRNILKEIHNIQAYFFSSSNKECYREYKMLFNAEEVQKMGDVFINNWNKFKTFVPTELYKDYEEDIVALTSNITPILNFVINDLADINGNIKSFVHGDLWANNFMFKKDSNGTPLNEVDAIIDWQMIHAGSIGSDLARAIVLGCQPEIRREIETVDLPKYYENLKREVIKRGGEFEMTWEMFKLNYDYCLIEQSVQLLMMYGFVLHNYTIPEDRPDYMWDARKYAIGSRIIFALKDAVNKCRVLKPEWLISKVKAQ
uniref:CHK domain-containing protein n=1 Tax=Rhabditophanes sp. KR3021 TaxID=114890 RepID=A0AC35TTR6_9BILA